MFIKPLNPTFFAMFAFFVLLLIVSSAVLKEKTRKTKRIALGAAMFATFIYYWVYKYNISIDVEYNQMRNLAGLTENGFTWWDELPLHLCNINLMLLPIACLTDNKRLYSFCFFCAPLGAIMALLMPGVGFEEGYSLFVPRIMGFYLTHFMIFVGGIAVASFGLYKPSYKDVLPTAISILLVSLVIFAFNMFLRKTGIYQYANYFFNVSTDGNAILDIFYNIIPIPYVYQIGLLVILIPYILLITAIINLTDKIKNNKVQVE